MAEVHCTMLCLLVAMTLPWPARASDVRQAQYTRNSGMDDRQLTTAALFQTSAYTTLHCGMQCDQLDGCSSCTYIVDQPSFCRGNSVVMTSPHATESAIQTAGAKTFSLGEARRNYSCTSRVADVDECSNSPCQNGGTCTNQLNGYLCQCAPGYTGLQCQTVADVDECTSSPCQNGGTCTNQLNGYLCQCAPGYTGLQCQTDVDECSSSPCQNGGTCTDQLNGYLCQCAPGFTGLQCQTDVDECSSSPCPNGGTCIDQLNGYLCQCAPGFTGLQCQTVADVDECSSSPCQNGGTCTDQLNGYLCQCAPGYTGLQCQTGADWLESPCSLNDECPVAQAECFKGKCLCTPGYYYSNRDTTCLTDCPLADLAEGYLKYENSALLSSNLWWQTGMNLSVCLEQCLQVTNCRSLYYTVARTLCNLKNETALTAPSSYSLDVASTDHYQRTCN